MKRLGSTCLAMLTGMALLGGCTSSTEDAERKNNEPAAATTPTPAKPLDRTLVPSEILAGLEEIELKSESPCSLAIDSLRPALAALAELRKALDLATESGQAVTLLRDAAATLRGHTRAIPARTESDELRRIRAELVATLGDLAEGLDEASAALKADNKAVADANHRRIQNGVQNTRSTIQAAINQCALP